MKNKFLSFTITFWAFVAWTQQPVDFVNPFIGTENSIRPSIWEANGGTYPGAVLPFGMVQATPEDYHYNTRFIKSFSLLNHISGYPHGSKGNFQIMPVRGDFSDIATVGSSFRHDNEIATPGYYSVFLEDYAVRSEMTATVHAAFFRFTFEMGESNAILIHDLDEAHQDPAGKITGKSHGYHFVLMFDAPLDTVNFNGNGLLLSLKGNVSEVLVKIGFSPTSKEKAIANLNAEIPHWNFNLIKDTAHDVWNEQLNRIIVEGNNATDKELFYTALYHTYLAPQIISDVKEPNRYANLSPWDTYRCKQPLLTLLDSEIQKDMVQSVLDQYEKDGLMDPGPMTGVHNIPILTDSYFKGIDFDIKKAYKAMETSLMIPPYGRKDIKSFYEHNYVPAEIGYSVTKTMEYAYNFWAMAQIAKELGKASDYSQLLEKSTYFKNIYNPETKFMTAKTKSGAWAEGGYSEGDKWSYNWTCTYDIQGLINLAGGNEEFVKQLDTCFYTGHYFHDNEPQLHNAYLYSYAGQPWKTQETVRNILDLDYSNHPGGISGNDDLGALSAWYVFSAMGFYPVCPGKAEYVIGTPRFEKVTISPFGGKPFVIHSKEVSKKNKYIQSVSLNAQEYSNLWLSHQDIVSGGTLTFKMGEKPNIRAIHHSALPFSETKTSPEFKIEEWGLSKNKFGAGDPVEISILIENNTACAGTVPITIFINDKIKTTKWFLVDGPGHTFKTTSLKFYKPGTYTIRINEEGTKTFEIEADKKAEFSYESLKLPLPSIAKTNTDVEIKTRLKNIGSFAGTERVELVINGKITDQLTLHLEPGEAKNIRFEKTFPKGGHYEIQVGKTKAETLLVYGPEFSEEVVYNKRIKPIMAYDFNSPGVSVIEDFSYLHNPAIVHGAVEWVDGIFGKAIKTNAFRTAYIEIPNHPKYDNIANGKIMTMMLWVYPLDEKNFSDIISKGDLNVIQVRASNTEVNYYSGGYQRGEAYTLLPEDWNRNWHHLAGVSDEQNLKLYIDGQLMVTKPLEEGINFTGTTDHPWNIGRNASHPDRVFDGYIDQLMIFDKALSQKEIKEFMLFMKD
ncbi:GH92 family glycosyl hydrolase [Aestuariivivens sediminicola]|uniref:GH92 family glycosyl hydrolase n=1 Tax=Aestuariivivens sediminicola TaxID=2913560 RepID=UPI001F55FB32|nr:GH92 family glycosyl hydrolase [Aestuariivivens sediminicola]